MQNDVSPHYKYLESAFKIKEMMVKGKLSVGGFQDEDSIIEHCSIFH